MEHEKLICYQQVLRIAEELNRQMDFWPRGYAYLSDQVKRALASSLLNLAEGNGKRSSSKERKRFFEISMASLSEVAACLDLAKVFNLISDNLTQEYKDCLRRNYYRIRKLP